PGLTSTLFPYTTLFRSQGSLGDGSGLLRIDVDPWVGVLQDEGGLARGESEVDGDSDCADPLRGEIDDDEFRGVVQLVDDAVASADSGCVESCGEFVDYLAQVSVRPLPYGAGSD